MSPEDYVTTGRAAALLGVSQGWLTKQINGGRMRAEWFMAQWAIPLTEIDRYRREQLGRPGRRRAGEPPVSLPIDQYVKECLSLLDAERVA